MEAIFHEKQEGSLCAQHCLNALLQNQLFTAVELAELAQRLDERERQHMLEGGINSREYQHFMEQPSSNYDDSGFFSIQVLQEALRVWNLELVPFTSTNPIAQQARNDPTSQKAYICNFRQHWFCVRKLGNQWFNLNSLLTGPELISDTYLSLFLTQLQQEGYSLFIVTGELAECDADRLLYLLPAVQPIKPSLITPEGNRGGSGQGHTLGGSSSRWREDEGDEDQYLQMALAESRSLVEKDDSVLQQALKESMKGYIEDTITRGGQAVKSPTTSSRSPAKQPTAEELRQKRLAYLQQGAGTNSPSSSSVDSHPNTDEPTDDDLLQEALRMSMEQPK